MIVCDRCEMKMLWASSAIDYVRYEHGNFSCTTDSGGKHLCEECRREIVAHGTTFIGGIGNWKPL